MTSMFMSGLLLTRITRPRSSSVAPRARAIGALILAVVAFGQGALLATSHEGTPSPVAAPCVLTSPQATSGTPAIAASPAPHELQTEELLRPGIPVTESCLTVALTADKTTAGPRTLTVEVVGADGTPIGDAEVMTKTRHLEMDHGTSTYQARPTGRGRYVAEKVSLGMSGVWQVEVVVTRPGYEPVVVTFVVELEGPA